MENKAIIFVRVSTRPQQDGTSPEAQLQQTRKYAKAHGLEVEKEIVIAETGWDVEDKKVFRALLAEIKEKKIPHLIVQNEERLTRSPGDRNTVSEMCRQFLSVHFTESGRIEDPGTSPEERAMSGVMVNFSRLFIDQLKQKARKSFEVRLDSGLYPSNPPLGFDCKKNLLSPNGKESPLIRKMFELYASGLYSEFSLAERMYDLGLRKRKGGKVSVTTISEALHNPLYIGYVSWPWDESKYVARDHTKGELIKGQHDGIVDRHAWERVQKILAEKSHPWSRRNNFQAYRGLMRCGACGRLMTPYTAKGRVYYYSNHPRGRRCEHKQGYPAELVEKKIREALARFKFPDELFEWAREVLKATAADNQAEVRAERKRIQTELNRAEEQVKKALSAALEDIFEPAVVKAKVAEIRLRQGQLRDALEHLEKDAARTIDDGIALLALVQDLPKAFDSAGPEDRAKMVRLLFKDVVVLNGKFDFHPADVFAPLFGMKFSKKGQWLLGQDSNLQPSG